MAVVWRLPKVPLLDRRMPQPHRPAMSRLLTEVRAWAHKRRQSEVGYANAVRRARDEGQHTFEEIAKAAGTTRSAIHNYLSRRGQT